LDREQDDTISPQPWHRRGSPKKNCLKVLVNPRHRCALWMGEDGTTARSGCLSECRGL
jgi:hypothetical protein